MSEERKKPGAAFWATLVMVALVLYVLSWGPAFWIDRYVTGPGRYDDACEVFYAPLHFACRNGPKSISIVMTWYARVWRLD
jgi:hypothetical protein